MTGIEYEQWCAARLRKKGFRNVRMTKASGDQGIDLIAGRNGLTYGFQCKYYSSPIGNDAVQEAYAGKTYYGLDKAAVITNQTFTASAAALAEQTGVELYELETPVSDDHGDLILRIPALILFLSSLYCFAEAVMNAESQGAHLSILFFALVLFAALTSSIALTECAVSTFTDELGWSRTRGTVITGLIMLVLGTLSCLGYGPLSFISIIGMPFLDFFDFLTNSVMMPVSALMICHLVMKHMGIEKVVAEVRRNGHPFHREKIFRFMIRFACPLFILIILISSVASAFGLISM